MLALQDDSALVRFASVELVGKIHTESPKGAMSPRLVELCAVVQTRQQDASPIVRRAAFRLACAALDMEASKAPEAAPAARSAAADRQASIGGGDK